MPIPPTVVDQMTISQVASVLGLDEVDAVRPVPLTDADIANATRSPAPNRAQRRDGERRKRQLGGRR